MKRLILLLFLILVFPSSSLPIPYPGVDSDEYEDLSDKITRTRESDVESSRTDNPTRKASEDKRPWVGDSLIQAEDTIWPNFSSWNGPPTYPNPDGSRSVFPWDWMGHSWQGCTVSCDSTGWETSDLMGTNDCEAGKEIKCAIWPIITQTIVENVTVDGPVWWELKSPSKAGDGIGVIVLKIYPNATPGTKISIIATTVSLSHPGGSKDTASSERSPEPSGVRLIDNNANFDVFRANLNRASDADARTKVLKVLSKCDKTLRADCESECECVEAQPTVKSGTQAINHNTSTTVWVDSAGLACPLYEWTIDNTTGSGFSFVSGLTVTSGYTTSNDLETLPIYANDWACGYATITATDNCGESSSRIIRCADKGSWSVVCTNQSSHWEAGCGGKTSVGYQLKDIYDGGLWWRIVDAFNQATCSQDISCRQWNADACYANYPPPCGTPGQCAVGQWSCPPVGYPAYDEPMYMKYTYYEWVCP